MVAKPVALRKLGRFEARILVAVGVACAALWAVIRLGSEVGEGETSAFDRAILLALRQPGNPNLPLGPLWLRETARDLTALGGFTVLGLVTLAGIATMLVYRRYRQALVFGVTATVAQVASEAIKDFVGRPRPSFVTQYDLTVSSSYPSGHSLMAPAVYFTLAAIVAAGELRPGARRLLMIGSGMLVVAIGVSRVYLGVHWPTDVVAGWTLGSTIALAAWIALQQRPGRV